MTKANLDNECPHGVLNIIAKNAGCNDCLNEAREEYERKHCPACGATEHHPPDCPMHVGGE